MTHVHLSSPRPISECLAPSFVIASVVPSPCMETDFSIDPTWKYVDTVIDMTSSRLSTPDNTLNRTPQQQGPENPKKVHNGLTVTKRRRRPGRPLLSFAQLAARKAARKAARRSKRKWRFFQTAPSSAVAGQAQAKRPNGSSTLERLPVELLERIFLYALDPNFCRASPFLASAVSSERIYRTLIRLAFFKDDEPSTVLPDARERIAEALNPADYKTVRLDEVDRVNLQSTILKCNWCTKQRILAQLPALMGMIIQKHIIGAGIVLTHPEAQASLDGFLHGQGREIIEGASLVDKIYRFTGTAPDGKMRRMYIKPLVWVDFYLPHVQVSEVSHRVMSIRVIPDYLLRGRRTDDSNQCYFTEEDIDLLEIFRQEYGFDDESTVQSTGHDVQFSTDALQSGMRTAIATRNLRALTSLLKVHEYFFRRRWETDPPPGCANQSPDRPYALPEEYFLQAIRLPMPDAMHFFMKLLRCNAESIPPNSSELTQWAMDLSFGNYGNKGKMTDDENDRAVGLGKFLLDFMIDLPGYDDEGRRIPPEEELFNFGRLNRQVKMARRIINETYGSSIADWGKTMKEEREGLPYKYSFDVSYDWPTDDD